MRTTTSFAFAVATLMLAPTLPAIAFERDPFVAPEGRDRVRDLALGARERADRGACTEQNQNCDDPYAYRYVRRPWYPGYNSGYWVPAEVMRNRYRYSYTGPKYRYHPAWGVDKDLPGHNRDEHDGGHDRGDHEPMK